MTRTASKKERSNLIHTRTLTSSSESLYLPAKPVNRRKPRDNATLMGHPGSISAYPISNELVTQSNDDMESKNDKTSYYDSTDYEPNY